MTDNNRDGPEARNRQNKEKDRAPSEFWHDLEKRDLAQVCRNAGAVLSGQKSLEIHFLDTAIGVDLVHRCIRLPDRKSWRKTVDLALLELMLLVYLNNVQPLIPTGEMVGVRDLKEGHFFRGPHELKTAPVLSLFEDEPEAFHRSAEYIGGEIVDLADVAYKFLPLPKIPIYYLIWKGDAEFSSELKVLFDETVERHLSADAIWGIVCLLSDAILDS